MAERHPIVIVTGGAIDAGFEFNSSGLIKDSLPGTIYRTGNPPIEILTYPVGTTCSYEKTRALIPLLWDGNRDMFSSEHRSGNQVTIDLMLHMGMRTSSNAFCLETKARKNCYIRPGEDGQYLSQGDGNGSDIWKNLPDTLSSGFDIVKIRDRVVREALGIPIEISNDAGGYFCEFEFYSSLAEVYMRGEFARVAFLHTPAMKEEIDIQNGVKVVLKLICALLESVGK